MLTIYTTYFYVEAKERGHMSRRFTHNLPDSTPAGSSHYVRIGTHVAIIRRLRFEYVFGVFIVAVMVFGMWWLLRNPAAELTQATQMDWSTCKSPELRDGIYYMECDFVLLGWEQEALSSSEVSGGFLRQQQEKHMHRTQYGDFWSEWSGTRTVQKNHGDKLLNGHSARYVLATSHTELEKPFNHAVFYRVKEDTTLHFYDCVSRATSFALCESVLEEVAEKGFNQVVAELPNP